VIPLFDILAYCNRIYDNLAMSNEGGETTYMPSAHTEVEKLPQIPNVSIGLTGLLLDKFQYDDYKTHVILRSQQNPEIEEFWELDHFKIDETSIISLYNQKQDRRLQSVIVDDSNRIIKEIKIEGNSRETIILDTLHKNEDGSWT
jgi:hypothetical protein